MSIHNTAHSKKGNKSMITIKNETKEFTPVEKYLLTVQRSTNFLIQDLFESLSENEKDELTKTILKTLNLQNKIITDKTSNTISSGIIS